LTDLKVERPFRTIKEAHETLYHFNKPETEKEANEWLMRYLMNYNDNDHRSENHSRREDCVVKMRSIPTSRRVIAQRCFIPLVGYETRVAGRLGQPQALAVALSFCRLLGLGCPKQAFAKIATPR
jgi:hypothetical protein